MFPFTRLGLLLAVLVLPTSALAATIEAVLHKRPSCTCCVDYARYLEDHGYTVKLVDTPNLERVQRERGVPKALYGCHSMQIGGYVVEGHVPVPFIQRLLAEKPAIRGISLPGMPQGSPGMTGRKQGPFIIYVLGEGTATVYGTE